ncbi:putative bifunctional diguanylate cyclase/phosphodiesterase [Pengzhenrongella sp.]|jgi:diguanylate cyclase (GGDEF)-like protein/PAS domain S-box-containing protein|uniref:putative bifunctional diguanylate cyclase/phosphodiesterase n=1 Tax=Pengzhenrongella sp. TaxID=2888820 RepID=UPI002F92DB8E
MSNGLARRRLRPLQVVLACTTIVLFVGLNVLLSWSYLGMTRTSQSFADAAETMATLNNMQRETLVLLDEVQNSHDTASFDHAELRLQLLGRQQKIFAVIARDDGLYTELFAGIRRNADVASAAFVSAGSGPMDDAERESAATALRASGLPMKQLYDRSEIRLWSKVTTVLAARPTAERGMLGLSFMLVALGAVLVISIRRGVRSDFDRAYEAITREAVERQAAEAKLRESERRFRALVHHASDVFTVVDTRGNVTYQSPAVERALGHRADRLIGEPFVGIVDERDRPLVLDLLDRARDAESQTVCSELRLRTASGEASRFEVAISRLQESDGDDHGSLVLNYRDISERLRYQEQLARQAFEDPLTGLANRALFAKDLDDALSRPSTAAVAVLFLDLDRFKVVNDSLGHEAGDELLRQVAVRLSTCVRDRATGGGPRSWEVEAQDTLARLGGDEFTILLSDVVVDDLPGRVAARIVEALRAPFQLGENEVFISASVGIATGRPGETTPDSLMRDADTAMYHAKWNGKARYELFDPAMNQRATERLRLEADLRAVVDDEGLTLAYQPITSLATGKVVSVEALLRWHHAERGDISPADFVPIAEETGLILPIGRWVLGEACRQTAAWRATGLPDLTVNVNLSVRQFDDPGLVDHILRTLEVTGLPPAALCLEITETVLMTDVAQGIEILHELKALGVRTAIDDFGCGYSSLRYLTDFPIDVIKIDRSFIVELVGPASSTAILEAIIVLGTALGTVITAEGIETPFQLETLTRLGCTTGQGFLLARPMAADAILGRLIPGVPTPGRGPGRGHAEVVAQ